MFKNGFQINPEIPLLHTKVKKDYMYDLIVESSEEGTYNDEKTDELKQKLLVRNQKLLGRWKMLEVRYPSDPVNAAAASYAKNTIKVRY